MTEKDKDLDGNSTTSEPQDHSLREHDDFASGEAESKRADSDSESSNEVEENKDLEASSRDDFEEPWKMDENIDPLAYAEEAIDPELLALAEERSAPQWHRPIIMTVVCGLIIVMMAWFWQDLLYFFSAPQALDLGDAHDIRFSEDYENRYVTLEGIPLAPRNENPAPQCGGTQGFPTYQRRFLCRGHQSAIPVMGRPAHDLIIQRFMVRQLRIHYTAPQGREEDTLQLVANAARRVSSVHDVRPTQQGELGKLLADIEGTSGRTDISAIAKSIQFQIEASVPGIRSVRVERVRREVPGAFRGRLVRLGTLGSRFAAVAEYLNECTSYPVSVDTWVVLDGSEAGEEGWNAMGLCYGHAPRQYWPYLVLYIFLGLILVLNLVLLVRFFMAAAKHKT